ncbi:ABC-type antimicrobial peptide transport system permease component [Vibrio ponticus]|nr:ABC-type antimicrobial peptide transport system permease component [Vibrio ponticus]
MSPTLMLAWKSVNNRRLTACLTILTVAVSLVLLLGVERIRTQAKTSFANTISGTDLIVGGRSGK